jgi:hypothetical protein
VTRECDSRYLVVILGEGALDERSFQRDERCPAILIPPIANGGNLIFSHCKLSESGDDFECFDKKTRPGGQVGAGCAARAGWRRANRVEERA